MIVRIRYLLLIVSMYLLSGCALKDQRSSNLLEMYEGSVEESVDSRRKSEESETTNSYLDNLKEAISVFTHYVNISPRRSIMRMQCRMALIDLYWKASIHYGMGNGGKRGEYNPESERYLRIVVPPGSPNPAVDAF